MRSAGDTPFEASPSAMMVTLVTGALLIALAPILVRVSGLDPVASGFYRVLIAAPFLWVLVSDGAQHRSRRKAIPLRDLGLMVGAGLLLAADLGIWHISITMTSVANATLFNNCSPIFVAIAMTLIGRPPGPLFLVSLAVAAAGMAMLSLGASAGQFNLVGDLMAISTGAFYGGYILLLRRLRMHYSAAICMAVSTTAAIPALLIFALFRDGPLIPASTESWLAVIALGLVCHVVGQGLIARALAVLPATLSSMVLLLQPISAAILAWAIFGEAQTAIQIAGMGAVLVGIVLARKASENET